MYHPIEAIEQKLKRANENILNLNGEIAAFIEEHKSSFVGNKDPKGLWNAAQEFQERIPIRFSVLAGEIIQQFRSSLDHIAWALAGAVNRRKYATQIEFPVCAEESKKSGSEGKIELIVSADARRLVRECQPYLRDDPFAEPLWVLHDLDRLYKHRAIQLSVATINLGSPFLNSFAAAYASGHWNIEPTKDFARKIYEKMSPSPLIAFAEFRKGREELIITGLRELETETTRIFRLFEDELGKC